MSKFVKDAIQVVESAFQENWESSYLFDTNPPEGSQISDQAYIDWKDKVAPKIEEFSLWLIEIKEDIFDKLNASILSGEYFVQEGFETDIKQLLKAFGKIPWPGTADTLVQSALNEKLKANFIECFKLGISFYLDLFNEIRIRFQADGISYISISDFESRADLRDTTFDKHSNDGLWFFLWNVKVARLDHFLTPEEDDLRELQEAEFACRKSDANKFGVLLIEKAKFLIAKWVLRKEELTGDIVNAVAGGKTINLNLDSLQSKLLPYWRDYIESHYELDKRTANNKIKSRYEKINRSESIETQKLIDLHCQIKYYKDVKSDYKSLNGIRKEIERRWKESQRTNSISIKYSLSIAYLYVINNEFSFLLNYQAKEEKKIRELYGEIVSIQNKTGLKNFFPQHKYLEYLVNQLREIFNNRAALDAIKHSREIIKSCEEVFIEYKENIKWSEENYNYVFVLPFEDCFIPFDNELLDKVFVGSSFVLPLSKNKYKLEFEENRREFYTFKSSLEVFENLERDVKDNQNSQLRSMEIIGIFTAIVTFVATSIPSFQFIRSSYQAGVFMFALACSMGVFILMIIISSRGVHKLKEHWLIILLMFSGGLIGWYTLINWTSDPADKESKFNAIELKIHQIDSINNLRIDSLKLKLLEFNVKQPVKNSTKKAIPKEQPHSK